MPLLLISMALSVVIYEGGSLAFSPFAHNRA